MTIIALDCEAMALIRSKKCALWLIDATSTGMLYFVQTVETNAHCSADGGIDQNKNDIDQKRFHRAKTMLWIFGLLKIGIIV